MPLQIVTDSGRTDGIYLGGFNIAPDTVLIRSGSFGEAWESLCEHLAGRGALAPADTTDEQEALAGDNPEGCDWVDGHGWMVTADVVLRVVRPSHLD